MPSHRSEIDESRPSPDELLARVQSEEAKARRGKLKIFFGYAAGVGKTYAMLEAARREKAAGADVVVGYVEPHGRIETESLLLGLEEVPARMIPYRGVTLREFDLDAALGRKPALILVDELAHTNVEGSRHAKRWQDVEELLDAGIDVYTTLNVQHIESLNDVISQITGIIVRETLPDAVFEKADELELIDITPDELVERLRQGKVYVPSQAQRALQNFFQKSNLAALRELSLRRSADRINVDVEAARGSIPGMPTWPTSERIIVCVGASPTSAKVIRTAKRMAAALHADWIAVSVETPGSERAGPSARQRLAEHQRLAEQLGAETVTLMGYRPAEEIVNYAHARNATKIVVGKTDEPRWKSLLFRSIVDDLLRLSGAIDVYVIRGAVEESPRRTPAVREPFRWPLYAWSLLVVAACSLLAGQMMRAQLAESNVVMIYLAGIAFISARLGRGPGIAASIASVLTFDFFFVPPHFTFAVSDTQYFITFAVMLVIALTISNLTSRFREQVVKSRQRERRTEALFRLSRQLAGATGTEFLVAMAWKQLTELFGPDVALFLADEKNALQARAGEKTATALNPTNRIVAQWVHEHGDPAGAGSDTLPNATAFLVPLVGSQGIVGVLGIGEGEIDRLHAPDQRQLLETCASLIALAIERDRITLEAQKVLVQAEAERLRSSLLSSVSHDLRTPLAVIAGAGSSLLKSELGDDRQVRRELLQTILDESQRLARLVENLLEMTRFESGRMIVNKQWHVLEELVGSALSRMQEPLGHRLVHTTIPADLPLVPVDGLLIEQVLINLLDNACKYTPADSPLEIRAQPNDREIRVSVDDRGPGLGAGDEERVFEKFYRGQIGGGPSRRGAGLGLAICRAIITAHGGRIGAENRPGGGARFWFTLPIDGTPPKIELETSPNSSVGGRP